MSEGDGGINDLAGIGEVLNSAVANKVYDDGLSGPTKSAGKGLTDVVDGLRLFTLPFQMMATVRERIERWLERVRADVQPEQQVDAAPEIAGPVLEKLRFQADDNPLNELYLNLLRRAIDKERRDEAHPAFASIIGQLSALDALLLFQIWDSAKPQLAEYGEQVRSYWLYEFEFDGAEAQERERLAVCLEHLRALNLVAQPEVKIKHHHRMHTNGDGNDLRVEAEADADNVFLTGFGAMFCKAVLPDVFPGEQAEESSGDEKSA